MASFIDPANGDLATAEHVAQLVEDFQGLRNIPISLSGINDAATYALTLKNAGTGSRDLIAYAADGTTVLLQVDATGVTLGAPVNLPPGSISGSAIAAGSISNSMLGADVARDNLLANGGFEFWQRGNGPFTAANAYTSDRWSMSMVGGDTFSVSRDTANVDVGSRACAACTFTLSGGAGGSSLQQAVTAADGFALAGKTITLSLRVKTATANAVRVAFYDVTNAGYSGFSAYHTGGSVYQTLSVSWAVPANCATLVVVIAFAASCTAYLDNAMLVVGSQATTYVPLHPADDLARCLRYYEVLGVDAQFDLIIDGIATAGAQYAQRILPYRAIKPINPTVTIVGTWILSNSSGQPIVAQFTTKNVLVRATSTAAGQFTAANGPGGTGNQNVSVESNP